VSKKIKFLIIMSVSILISAFIALALMNFPELRIFPMQYDENMPKDLVSELVKVEKLSFVKIGQHGYNHSYGESFSDTMKGYEILNDNSLRVDYYIPPYEITPRYPVPAELFMIPYESNSGWYSDENLYYGNSTLNNSKALSIHIQDEISENDLEDITKDMEIKYLRVDDVNTDIVDTSAQIKRIYSLVDFCDKRDCTLVVGVIPHVLRLQESDKSYLFLNKLLLAISVMMVIPIYIFYLISHNLSRWFQ
jgi:hypothetical protein